MEVKETIERIKDNEMEILNHCCNIKSLLCEYFFRGKHIRQDELEHFEELATAVVLSLDKFDDEFNKKIKEDSNNEK